MATASSISQKEYLKKYLSGDVKKKKKKKITGANFKRSVIVDDDIDIKNMRPLEDDEVELYQMDEDAPQIAGIVDERPPEVKAQEYYSSKRWKVFGGEDGVNIVDSMNKDQQAGGKDSRTLNDTDRLSEKQSSNNQSNLSKDSNRMIMKDTIKSNKNTSSDKDNHHKKDQKVLSSKSTHAKTNTSDESPPRIRKEKSSRNKDDSDVSPPRKSSSDSDVSPPRFDNLKSKHYKGDSDTSPPRIRREKSSRNKDDSDASPPRKSKRKSSSDSDVSLPRRKFDKNRKDSDESPPRKDSRKKSPKHFSRYEEVKRSRERKRSYSHSPPRRGERQIKYQKYKSDYDDPPPRRETNQNKQYNHDSDASPPRRREPSRKQVRSDSDTTPPRRKVKYPDYKSRNKGRRESSRDKNTSPPPKGRRNSPNLKTTRGRYSRSRSPPENNSLNSRKYNKEKLSFNERSRKKQASDSDNSPQRRRKHNEGSDSDMSPPRKNSHVNERPLKKTLYIPNEDSSSDEDQRSKSKKMKRTLDGKQAGLQDARQLKMELSDLKMKEDTMFSKMDASVSGVGAAPVRRDRKTGQIRDLEKEKEAQKEKEAKESVVNEKYYKWGKGLKQTEDAAVRAAEAMKEMNKPLARYVDDADLDEFLKKQDREGDPMLEYIKKKQSESMPLQGEKPIYKGSWNPNRFNIRPGYRWDGVVRSNGYEQEWFKTKNAKKARDEEAYKWSTSDM